MSKDEITDEIYREFMEDHMINYKNLKTNESKVSEAKAPDTKDADNVALWILIAAVSVSIAGYSLKSSGHLN